MSDSGLTLSVVVPVYNEETLVRASIERLRAVPLRMQVICVDDASRDGSRAVLEAMHREGLIDVFLAQPANRGKGAAVRAGVERATGEVTVIHDADLEYDPFDLPHLLQPIADGRADAVFGSRFTGSPRRVLYFWHRLGNGLLTLVSNMMTDLNLTDMETCYKMVRTDLLKQLPLKTERFGIEPELTARLAQARARIYEVPISYYGRTYDEGKKIGWRDGIAAFWHIVRANWFGPRVARYLPDGQDRAAHPAGPARRGAAVAV
ncbi:MAG TPA: glycosyltransferase family 2 protein [Longimicrobium sp.]|nr:glycosyltransferase family 2 protein [Longimicrobium sp.]